MEELIKQAFLHVEVVGPQVQEGHYDLIAPDGEIILPTVWEKVVQPDWSITMHMWPMERMPRPMHPGMVRDGNGARPGHPLREGVLVMIETIPRPAPFPRVCALRRSRRAAEEALRWCRPRHRVVREAAGECPCGPPRPRLSTSRLGRPRSACRNPAPLCWVENGWRASPKSKDKDKKSLLDLPTPPSPVHFFPWHFLQTRTPQVTSLPFPHPPPFLTLQIFSQRCSGTLKLRRACLDRKSSRH